MHAYSANVRFIRFSGAVSLCDLTLASWEAEPAQVRAALPAGFEPIVREDAAFVSVVGFRVTRVRIARVPAPSYSAINVRTYARDRDGEPVIFVLQTRVTPLGMGGLLLGVPVRASVISATRGALSAAGMGVSVRYELEDGPPELPPLEPSIGEFDVAYWKAGGIRRLVTRHPAIDLRSARREGSARFDPVLALGFDLKEPRWLHYAERVDFELELPPRRVSRR